MKEIKNILICGAGMMGKNIGYVFASNPSFQVGMYDLYPTDVEAGIRTNTRQLLDKGVITEQELSAHSTPPLLLVGMGTVPLVVTGSRGVVSLTVPSSLP